MRPYTMNGLRPEAERHTHRRPPRGPRARDGGDTGTHACEAQPGRPIPPTDWHTHTHMVFLDCTRARS